MRINQKNNMNPNKSIKSNTIMVSEEMANTVILTKQKKKILKMMILKMLKMTMTMTMMKKLMT